MLISKPFTFVSLLLAVFFALCPHSVGAAKMSPSDSILRKLDDVLDRRDTYYVTREYRIDSLKSVAARIPHDNLPARAAACHDIFSEYGSFQGDSALTYATREYDLARRSGVPDAVVQAKSDLIFTYLSGGSFTDAVDIVNHIDLSEA
ncbi:MAG: hypothetical protein K2L57_00530, partial [Muribaculaceae bacterium]|nr:hypothetical protein [Muribaculaceae bacterium]